MYDPSKGEIRKEQLFSRQHKVKMRMDPYKIGYALYIVSCFIGFFILPFYTRIFMGIFSVVFLLHLGYLAKTRDRELHENWWFKRLVIGLDISCE